MLQRSNSPPDHASLQGIAWATVLIVALACAAYLYLAHPPQPSAGASTASDPGAAATVNGEQVSLAEFDGTLRKLRGQEVLQQLVEQKLIAQEARKLKLSLDDEDSVRRMTEFRKSSPPDMTEAAFQAKLLLRKIVLKDVSEGRLRHIYDVFKEDLTQYEVRRILVRAASDAQIVETAARKGESFAQLAQRYSTDEETRDSGGLVGYCTLSKIESSMGHEVGEAVYRLRDSGISPPIKTPFGFLLVKVGWVHSHFEELRPSVEDLVVNADSDAVLYRLCAEGKVTSTFLATDRTGSHLAPDVDVFAPASTPKGRASSAVFVTPTAVKPKSDSVFAPPSPQAPPSGDSVFAAPTLVR